MQTTQNVLATYATITSLAKVIRHNSTTFDAQRRENVAEHSYSLTLLASAIAHDFNVSGKAQLDIGKVAQFAAVHDLVETYMEEGDISVYAPAELLRSKKAAEQKALQKIEQQTPHSWIPETIKTYESQKSAEARFVYALDKIVVHMHVILSDKHHANPTFADYLRTEKAARKKIVQSYSALALYFDELCQMFRERPYLFNETSD